MKTRLIFFFVVVLAHLARMAVWADDGTWTNLTTGVWSDATQWADGVVGGGVGGLVDIAPGFGGARAADRMLQVPYEGVTLGALRYLSGEPLGAIRIFGGPLVFDNTGSNVSVTGGSGNPLNILSEIRGRIPLSSRA